MRFIENGPDIPDDLLIAQDEGRVVFFCGAGVSMARAGLPSFRKLLEDIVVSLGVQEDSKAYELFEQLKETKHYPSIDAIFTELERDFDKSMIEKEIACALRPKPGKLDLSAHKTMLQLAKQRGSGIRLVTTNFDRLFENASPKTPTHNPSNLLEIRNNPGEWGIIHLHGLVNKNYTDVENSGGLVLSSNGFGAAYLAHGWARNFISEILENHVTVFVGYRADDPPINYLLRGLTDAGIKNHPIYAFERGEENKVRADWSDKSATGIAYSGEGDNDHKLLWESLKAWSKRSKDPDNWRAGIFRMARKGPEKLPAYQRGMVAHIVSNTEGAKAFRKCKPVLPASWLCVFDHKIRFLDAGSCKGTSPTGEDNSFDPFQKYGLDSDPLPQYNKVHSPVIDISSQPDLASHFSVENKRKIPDNVSVWDAFEINERDWLDLKNSQISQFQNEGFIPYPFLPNRISELLQWIEQVGNSEVSVWWCGRQTRFHHDIIKKIVSSKSKRRVPSAIREAKSLILKHLNTSYKNHDLLNALSFGAARLNWDYDLVRRCVMLLQPHLKMVNCFIPSSDNDLTTLEVPPQCGYKYSRRDIVNYDVEYKKPLGEEWVDAIPVKFLSFFIEELLNGIQYALAFEKQITGYYPDLKSLDTETDADLPRFQFGFNSYVSIFIKACQRLGSNRPDELRFLLKRIPNKYTHLERIKLWLCSFPEFTSMEMYMEVLTGLSKKAFWDPYGLYEIPSGIQRRWGELPLTQRQLIKKRIKQAPHYKQVSSSKRKAKKLILQRIFYQIAWLSERGCNLEMDMEQFKGMTRTLAREKDIEKLIAELNDDDAKGQLIRPDTDPTCLQKIPLKNVITFASKKEIYPRYGNIMPTPFAGFVSHRDHRYRRRAVGALYMHKKTFGQFPKTHWGKLLCHDARKDDTNRTLIVITARLLDIDRQDLHSIIYDICVWLRNIGPRLYQLLPNRFDSLWKMCMVALKEDSVDSFKIDNNARTSALNSSSGNLAQMLINFPKQKSGKRSSYIKKNIISRWRNYAYDLINLPNQHSAYAIIFFAHNAHWFYYHDKKFAMELVVNYLTYEKNNDSMSDAAWSGILWNSTNFPQLDLYRLLLPTILDRLKVSPSSCKLLQDGWAWFLLAGWRFDTSFVSDGEFRKALLNGGMEFQLTVLNLLSIWTRKIELGWAELFPDFMKRVWPKQRIARTKDVSAMLVRIVLGMCKNIEEATQEVLPFIRPTKTDTPNLSIFSFSKFKDGVFLNHPNEIVDLLYAILTPDTSDWGYGIRERIQNMKFSNLKANRKRKLKKLKDKLP